MQLRWSILAAVALLLDTATATAQEAVCVQLDASRDTLAEQEQRAVVSVLISEFEKAGVVVDTTGAACAGVYTVYNIRLGESINVTIHGPLGRRDAQARKIDELPQVYSQMVRALVYGEGMTNDSAAVDRTNVTIEQTAPKRVAADSLKYVRLGYGSITGGGDFASGPGFGFGYRHELDMLAIDGSLNMLIADEAEGNAGLSGSWIKLMLLRFHHPLANASPFFGGGVSWGGTAVGFDDQTYTGSGLQAELTAGYELMRASTIRVFVELNATLPLYDTDGRYTPSFVLNVGGGYGKTRTVRVIND